MLREIKDLHTSVDMKGHAAVRAALIAVLSAVIGSDIGALFVEVRNPIESRDFSHRVVCFLLFG